MPAKDNETKDGQNSFKIGSLKIDGSPILGVKWSGEEKVAILTNKNVCIATLNYKSHGHFDSPLFDVSALSLPEINRTETFKDQWLKFVSPDKMEFEWSSVALNRALLPNKSFLYGNSLVIDVQWPPTSTEVYQRGIVAVNSADHSLLIHEMKILTGKWSVLMDLTAQLSNLILSKISDEIIDSDYPNILPKVSIATSVWLSHTFTDVRPIGDPSTRQCYLASFLAGVTLDGTLVIWKIGWTQTQCWSDIVMETDLKVTWPRKLLWLEKSLNDGILVVSFASGVIMALHIKVCPGSVEVLTITNVWIEEDEMVANHMTSLEAKDDSLRFAICKAFYIIAFNLSFKPNENGFTSSYQILPYDFNDEVICLFCKDGKTLFAGDCHGKLLYSNDGGVTMNTFQLDVQRGHQITGVDLSSDSSMLLATNVSCKLILNQELAKKASSYVQACLYHFPFVNNIIDYHLIESTTALTGLRYEVLRLKTIQLGKVEESITALASRPFMGDVSPMDLQKQIAANRLVIAQLITGHDEAILPWLETSLFVNSCASRLKHLLAKLNHRDWTTLTKTDIACLLRLAISIQKSVSNPTVWKDIISPPLDMMHCLERYQSQVKEALDPSTQQSDRLLANLEETCCVCKDKILFESPDIGSCSKGHSFKRCCLTLAVNQSTEFRQCCNCGRQALTRHLIANEQLAMVEVLLNETMCPMCSGHLVNIKIP